MSRLRDTNACIALMNGVPAMVRRRFEEAIRVDFPVYVSSVVTFELWYGIAKSARVERNTERLELLLSGPVVVLPLENGDSRVAGLIRGAFEAAGRPIGATDCLIAGQALARELALVTANVSEFSRAKGLQWQDWAKS
jgi:tRNA(fMet)-specific endonuclease VapC